MLFLVRISLTLFIPERVIHYVQHVDRLDFTGIAFIVPFQNLKKETAYLSTCLDMTKIAFTLYILPKKGE